MKNSEMIFLSFNTPTDKIVKLLADVNGAC